MIYSSAMLNRRTHCGCSGRPCRLPVSSALAFDLVGGRAVLGHAASHAHPPAVAAEELPVRQTGGLGDYLHPPGDLRFRQPEDLITAGRAR